MSGETFGYVDINSDVSRVIYTTSTDEQLHERIKGFAEHGMNKHAINKELSIS